MKLQISRGKKVVFVVALGSLVFLPSCGLVDWVKSKFGGSKGSQTSDMMTALESDTAGDSVIVSMDGKPLITKDSLAREKSELIESNPQLKAMIAFMPAEQLDRNLTDGLTNQAIVERYIANNNIDQTDEYKQEYARMMKNVKHMLNGKYFGQGMKVEVTDSDVKKFYDENKDSMPNLLLSQGGVKAIGVAFDTESAARDFAKKVDAAKGDVKKVADASGLKSKVKDFNSVNRESLGLDTVLRDKIVAIESVPSTHVVKVDEKSHWVVRATAKEEAKYRPLETIKADLKQYLEKEKRAEALEKEIGRLREEYKVVVNENFFASDAKNEQATLQAAMTSKEETVELQDKAA